MYRLKCKCGIGRPLWVRLTPWGPLVTTNVEDATTFPTWREASKAYHGVREDPDDPESGTMAHIDIVAVY